jgi:hypothetical protein
MNIAFKEMKNKIPWVYTLMKCVMKVYGCTSKYQSPSCLLMLSSFTNEHNRHKYTVFKVLSVLKLKHFDNQNHKQKYFIILYCGQLYQPEDRAGVFRYPRMSCDDDA